MIPMVVILLYIFGIGPIFGVGEMPVTKRNIHLFDASYSARPLSNLLEQVAPPNGNGCCLPGKARCGIRRCVLSQSRGLQLRNARRSTVAGAYPDRARGLRRRDPALSRRPNYTPLFTYPAQNLVVYKVSANLSSHYSQKCVSREKMRKRVSEAIVLVV